jgi:hypothetical protein
MEQKREDLVSPTAEVLVVEGELVIADSRVGESRMAIESDCA